MSTGAEYQLNYIGQQDAYLVGNPQLSYFKAGYKQYTNFSRQLIELDIDSSTTLSNSDDIKTIKYKISRYGDLLKDIIIRVDIPNIYSHQDKKFQWIRRLGEYLIQEIRVVGSNSRVFNRLTSEYLHIYSETTINNQGLKEEYYKNIGHIKEFYDPAAAHNNLYPESIPAPSFDGTNYSPNFDGIPSITGQSLYIRIPFWFCSHSGSTIPLVALQNMELRLEIDLRPMKHLYTVIDTNPASTTFGTRIRPSESYDLLSNYTDKSNNNSLDLVELQAYGEFIYLNRDERKVFSQIDHLYLMNQPQYQNTEITSDSYLNINLSLESINSPIKQFYFMIRRIDNELTNQWSNFTLWEKNEDNISENILSSSFYSEYNNNIDTSSPTTLNKSLLTSNLIDQVELLFDGNNRFDRSKVDLLKCFNYNTNNNSSLGELDGIYNYSFALNNGKYQPSGSCNFSRIGSKELRIYMKNLDNITRLTGLINGHNEGYRLLTIFEGINFFRVISGMADVEFVI
jgi:hypothetical protein